MNKFLIIGNARSGTTLLNEALAKHPKLNVTFEAFHENARKGNVNWRNSFHVPFKKDSEFLDALYEKYDGFKMLYDQTAYNAKIWEYFQEKDIKTIHLIRKNIAETVISLALCVKSNIWQNKTIPGQKLIETFEIEPPQLEIEIKKVEKEIISFSTLPFTLTMYYEDMVSNWNESTNKICKILDVPQIKLKQTVFKRTQPLKSILPNYSEHKKYFEKTSYAKFFVNEKIFL